MTDRLNACMQHTKKVLMETAEQVFLMTEKYKGVIQRFQRSSIDNEFVSLRVPTKERPWVTITMSRCTFSEAVPVIGSDKKSSFDEIPDVVTEFDEDGTPMRVSADSVKELRRRTRRGMMECKKALLLTAGDMDAAVLYLKKHL